MSVNAFFPEFYSPKFVFLLNRVLPDLQVPISRECQSQVLSRLLTLAVPLMNEKIKITLCQQGITGHLKLYLVFKLLNTVSFGCFCLLFYLS